MAGEKVCSQKRKCVPRSCEHDFVIKPKHPQRCWLKSDTKVDFCPLLNENQNRYENIIPIFNNDEQSCLPGFILEIDKVILILIYNIKQYDYHTSMKKYKEDHERKIQEYTMKKKQLVILYFQIFFYFIKQIPKPGRKHRYCGVCRKPYTDYLEHIKSSDHISHFGRHEFVGVINKLIEGDYRSKDEKVQQDSSTYPKVDLPIKKKRGRKPKQQPQQQIQPPVPVLPQQIIYPKPYQYYYPFINFMQQQTPGFNYDYLFRHPQERSIYYPYAVPDDIDHLKPQ